MAFIIYSTGNNAVIGKANCLYADEPVIREDEILIPCAADADLSDTAHWTAQAEAIADGSFVPPVEHARAQKIREIRAAALAEGQQGANILAAPGVSYHMALTPEDVALLQQANMAAKIAWQAMNLPQDSPYRIAEIKEKWVDGRTQLHLSVSEAVHDSVLAQAAMQAAEIYRKQETLIQAVNDAETAEAVGAVTW